MVDFADGMNIYPSIAKQLKHLDIGILSKSMHACVYKLTYAISMRLLS